MTTNRHTVRGAARFLCTLGDRQAFVNAYAWLQWPLLIGNFGLLFGTYLVRKKSPLNLVMLAAWTACMAVSIGAVSAAFVEAGEASLILEVGAFGGEGADFFVSDGCAGRALGSCVCAWL